MSYYHNYNRKALRMLDEKDRQLILGYRYCMEKAACYFEFMNVFDGYDEEEAFDAWMYDNEKLLVSDLFDDPKYRGIDLYDECDDEDDLFDDYFPYCCGY